MTDHTTIREMIEALTELAAESPAGAGAEIAFAICNGTDLQIVDEVDVSHYTRVQDGEPDCVFVMFRAHVHPGEKPGELLRGASAGVDQELRELLDNGDG